MAPETHLDPAAERAGTARSPHPPALAGAHRRRIRLSELRRGDAHAVPDSAHDARPIRADTAQGSEPPSPAETRTRALAGLESVSAVWDPRVIDAELWIQILWRNFGLRKKTKRSRPPAKALGLARKSEGNPDLPGLAWDFRLGMSHAEKMSAWCGK